MSSLSLSTPLRQSEVVQGPGRDFDLGPRTFPGCTWCPLTNLLLPGYIFFAFARKLITWRDPKETTATVAPALVTWTWSWEVVRPFNLDSFHTNAHKFVFFFWDFPRTDLLQRGFQRGHVQTSRQSSKVAEKDLTCCNILSNKLLDKNWILIKSALTESSYISYLKFLLWLWWWSHYQVETSPSWLRIQDRSQAGFVPCLCL